MTLDLRNRRSLMASLPHGGVGAEVGVLCGEFSAVLLEANAPRRLYLVDCWTYPAHLPEERRQEAEREYERQYETVMRLFQTDDRVRVMRMYSLQAAAQLRDANLDWVYIDANHEDIANDLAAWVPVVNPGGWVTGHDYMIEPDGTPNAVHTVLNEFVRLHGLELLVTAIGSGQDAWPSWAFQNRDAT